jgi:hypothetical protein
MRRWSCCPAPRVPRLFAGAACVRADALFVTAGLLLRCVSLGTPSGMIAGLPFVRTKCSWRFETTLVWGRLVAPLAEYVARVLWGRTNQSTARRRLSTPLTQQHRREAKGRPSFPKAEVPTPDRLCLVCGKKLLLRNRRFYGDCAVTVLRKNLDIGRKAAQRPEFLAKREWAFVSGLRRRSSEEVRFGKITARGGYPPPPTL